MSVIFFEGFNHIDPFSPNFVLDVNNFELVGGSTGSSYTGNLFFDEGNTNNLKLKNIGTHSAKKVYLGFRAQSYSVSPAEPLKLVEIYDSAASTIFSVEPQTTYNSTIAPDMHLDIKNAAGTTLGTFRLLDAIATTGVNGSAGDPPYGPEDGYSFFTNTPRVLEFEINLIANTVAMRYEGQNLLTITNSTTVPIPSTTGISSLAFFSRGASVWTSAPTGLQDFYLIDDADGPANTWLGADFSILPLSFETASPAYVAENWVDNYESSAVYANNVMSLDNDLSYVNTASFPNHLLFNVQQIFPPQTLPVVGGLRLHAVARKVSKDSKYVHAYQNTSGGKYELGPAVNLTSTAYSHATGFVDKNPETNAAWTVTQINSGFLFGIKSLDPSV